MKTKISLIMTGAVSLGSFEAGVLTEVLYALDYRTRQGTPYELDVVTGASAGAMTAALVGHIVMNDFRKRSNLYRAWVELVSIENLLADPPANALLSADPIHQIAEECITPPYSIDERASFAPDVMRMTLTLSNLNGYDRAIKPLVGAPFVSTFFDDHRTFLLASAAAALDSARSEATWNLVRQFAIASGSFPIAFPPISLTRNVLDYDDAGLISAFCPLPTYVDGGLFNNQPIGEAVRLSREADAESLDQPRRYLFVNASVDNSLFMNQRQMAPILDAPPMLVKRIADVIVNEARASDWIKALLINDQVVWRDRFVDSLIGLVQNVTVDNAPALIDGLTNLDLSILVERKDHPFGRPGTPALDDLLASTRAKYKARLDAAPELGPTRRTVLELIFFALDHIADLDARKRIDLMSIAPQRQLAGEQLDAFGGFFKKEYREYNFRYGRQVAHGLLSSPVSLGAYPREQGPEPYQQYEIEPGWVGFPQETLGQTPRPPREKLRDLLVARAKAAIPPIKITGSTMIDGVVLAIVRYFVGELARLRLDKMLELDK